MSATVATGVVLLTPKFDNLTDSIESQLNSAFGSSSNTASKAGSTVGSNFSSSMATKLGAVSGIVSTVASKAIDVIGNSLGSAISRVDTLNQFPKVMTQMGFGADVAQASIDKLSAGIDGLPTSLDTIVSSTQSIALLTGDLDGATDTALALNNAFLASGSSTADAERGLTQYTQMLSKGSVDLQSWRTLQETMGYALRETANAMGFVGDSAVNDLYSALQSGDVTFDEFNAKLVELNQAEGGFASTAAEASAGIQTSMDNAGTAVTKNLANIINALNQSGAISGFFDGLKVVINGIGSALVPIATYVGTVLTNAFTMFGNVITTLTPVFSLLTPVLESIGQHFATLGQNLSFLSPLLQVVATVIGGVLFAALGSVLGLVDAIVGFFANLSGVIPAISNAFSTLSVVIPEVLMGVLSYLGSFVVMLLEYGINAGVNFVNGVLQFFDTLPSAISGIVSSVVSVLTGFVGSVAAQAISAGSQFLSGISNGFNSAVSFVSSIPSRILSALGNVGSLLYNAGASIINGLLNGIKSAIGAVYDFVGGIASTIASLKGPLSYDRVLLTPAGEAIINGLQTGLENNIGDVYSFVGGIAGGIQDAFAAETAAQALTMRAQAYVETRASKARALGITEGTSSAAGNTTNIYQNTKVVRSDADLYSAATILNGNMLRLAGV